MIPPIWFLEIDRISLKLGRVPLNRTEGDELKAMIEQGLISQTALNDKTVCCLSSLLSAARTATLDHSHRLDRPRLEFSLAKGERQASHDARRSDLYSATRIVSESESDVMRGLLRPCAPRRVEVMVPTQLIGENAAADGHEEQTGKNEVAKHELSFLLRSTEENRWRTSRGRSDHGWTCSYWLLLPSSFGCPECQHGLVDRSIRLQAEVDRESSSDAMRVQGRSEQNAGREHAHERDDHNDENGDDRRRLEVDVQIVFFFFGFVFRSCCRLQLFVFHACQGHARVLRQRARTRGSLRA